MINERYASIQDIHSKTEEPDGPTRPQQNLQTHYDTESNLALNTFGFPDNFDENFNFSLPFYIDRNVRKILEVGLTLQFLKFRANSRSGAHSHDVTISDHTHDVTLSNHTHTVNDHTHNVTIGNHTHTVSDHTHTVFRGNSSTTTTPSSWTRGEFGDAVGSSVTVGGSVIGAQSSASGGGQTTSAGGGTTVSSAAGGGQTTSAGGGTTVSSASGGGQTVTSATAASSVYGVYEGSYPSNVNILLDGEDITAKVGGPFNPTTSDNLIEDIDLTGLVTQGGLHTIEFTSDQVGRCLPLLYVKSIIGR